MSDEPTAKNVLDDPHVLVEFEAYTKAAKGPPVMVVLRSHLLTEYYLERVIRACISRGDKLIEGGSLSYAQKLAVVEALDVLPDTLVSCLRNLNRVRNRCAHEFERNITMADCDQVGGPFGKEHSKHKKAHPKSPRKVLNLTIATLTAKFAAYVHNLEEPPAKLSKKKV